ncbi:hypothetical protein [Sphingomonas xinjiangensis]|uniref:DUF4267 domain-containing protein n=1 Tax=Sphingomonas xinjiangensis TaxID=643568 RepID=A0A840YD29_9SPHN|nr:hypothetical protein [Sphingomonas xinjiangensis]MBB5710195.1 hypothetical protein [Sphingomonas xinjiangensis]
MRADYKQLSKGLGWFSLALGAAELLAPRKITQALDAQGHETLVKAFGAREIAAGLAILGAPAHAERVGSRVAGDALDLGALALAARNSPRNPWVWGAIGFVVGATIADVLVARGLKQVPDAEETAGAELALPRAGSGRATSAEPAHTARGVAPVVG